MMNWKAKVINTVVISYPKYMSKAEKTGVLRALKQNKPFRLVFSKSRRHYLGISYINS